MSVLLSVKFPPSQLHCCMSDANMAAPLSLAWLPLNLITTFYKEEDDCLRVVW